MSQRINWILVCGSILSLVFAACETVNKNLTVDQIQGVVNSIERNLRHMRKALKAAEGDKAAEHYAKAEALMGEYQEALAGYPERSELERQVEESRGDLCYGQVSLAIRDYFTSIRAQARDEAKARLDRARAEYDRCEPIIREREDFMALKMNMDSSPDALTELDKALFRPKRLAQIQEVIGRLKAELNALRGSMKSLEASPDQPSLAAQIDADIGKIREGLGLHKAYEDEEIWTGFAAATQGELTELAAGRERLIRRGKVLLMVGRVLEADAALRVAPKNPDRAKAAAGVSSAKQTYSECVALIDELSGEEKELAAYVFAVNKSKRKIAWLQRHCRRSVGLADKLYAKLLGKKPPVAKKPPQAEKKPEAKPAQKPEIKKDDSKKSDTKKKKKKKRRRDIQRW